MVKASVSKAFSLVSSNLTFGTKFKMVTNIFFRKKNYYLRYCFETDPIGMNEFMFKCKFADIKTIQKQSSMEGSESRTFTR